MLYFEGSVFKTRISSTENISYYYDRIHDIFNARYDEYTCPECKSNEWILKKCKKTVKVTCNKCKLSMRFTHKMFTNFVRRAYVQEILAVEKDSRPTPSPYPNSRYYRRDGWLLRERGQREI